MPRSHKTLLVAAAVAALGSPAWAAGNHGLAVKGVPAGAPARVELTVDGPVLVTTSGMSLYQHGTENLKAPKFAWKCTNAVPATTDDQQSGIGPRPNIGAKLIKSCLDKFKPYAAEAGAQPVGDFTIAERPDGTKQWAFRGYPLYLSIKDNRPGERNAVNAGFLGGGVPGGGAAARFNTGVRPSWVPMELPAGLKFSRKAEGLVLVSGDTERTVYTPKGGKRFIAAAAGREDFKPIPAPAIGKVSGDWSILDDGTGQKQYAYQGKPLFTAPQSLNDLEIASARAWEPVTVVKAPPVPAAIGTKLTLAGDVYTDRKGKTLYLFNCNAGGAIGPGEPRVTAVSCDGPGDPAAWMVALCGDGKECAKRWRPYLAPAGAKPEGEFSILDITYPMFTDMRGTLYPADAPKVRAWAYRGKPLFTYYEDEKPGDIWGHTIGGIWGSTWNAAMVPGKGGTFFEP